MRTREEIAAEVLACAMSWDDCVCLIGNVRADELAYLALGYVAQHARNFEEVVQEARKALEIAESGRMRPGPLVQEGPRAYAKKREGGAR